MFLSTHNITQPSDNILQIRKRVSTQLNHKVRSRCFRANTPTIITYRGNASNFDIMHVLNLTYLPAHPLLTNAVWLYTYGNVHNSQHSRITSDHIDPYYDPWYWPVDQMDSTDEWCTATESDTGWSLLGVTGSRRHGTRACMQIHFFTYVYNGLYDLTVKKNTLFYIVRCR
jgi:hypothetical protein